MKPLSKGSVKDLYLFEGRHCFQFSDRYSLFDWGEMPDQIQSKGQALAKMAVSFFELLKRENIRTHFVSAIDKNFNRLNSHDSEIFGFEFVPARVVKPILKSDHTFQYEKLTGDFFIPLEVIFRLGVPEGSSKSKEHPVGTIFETPLVEFTTKLEKQDRFLSESEAFEISSLSIGQFYELKRFAATLGELLKEFLSNLGIELWDGKFEFALVDQELILVDAIGPDELRMNFKNIPVSKELLRKWYRGSDWYSEVLEKKKVYATDWKSLVQKSPEVLNPQQLNCISEMYSSLATDVSQKVFQHEISEFRFALNHWVTKHAGVL